MGWKNLEKPKTAETKLSQLELLCLTVFSTRDGQELLKCLNEEILQAGASPDATESALRHLEGRRSLVRDLNRWIANGRRPSDAGKRSGS